MRYKTTKKHFEYFRKRCLYWAERFSLNDWEFRFFHNNKHGGRAIVHRSTEDRLAEITLGVDWNVDIPTLSTLNQVARHEILHVLVDGLSNLCYLRGVPFNTYAEQDHAIINRIEHALETQKKRV